MYTTILIVFLLVSILLVTMIMIQQSNGIDMGASYNVSASATLFGSSGSSNFTTKIIVIFATLFFIISLILGNLTSDRGVIESKWKNINEPSTVNKKNNDLKLSDLPVSDIPD